MPLDNAEEAVTSPDQEWISTVPDEFTITIFADQAAADKIECCVTLHELASEISKPTAAEKSKLPWLELGRFGDQRSEKNCLRRKENLLSITGVECDYDGKLDGGKTSLDEAVQRLRWAGVEAIVYTSPSHTAAAPRWRVLCPFASEYRPEERDRFLDRLNGVLGGVLEPESWTLSRAYYYGNVEGKPPVQVVTIPGIRLDLIPDLEVGAMGKGGAARTTRAERRTAPEGLVECDDDPRLIDEGRERIARAIAKRGGEKPYADDESTGTFPVAAELLDMRTVDGRILSREGVVDLLLEHWGADFDLNWTEKLVDNAIAYRTNDRGCTAINKAEKILVAALKREAEAPSCRIERAKGPLVHFRGRADALARSEPEMLVETIIPARKLILPYGGTGCGKTYWSLEIATAVAMRRPAFDRFEVMAPGDAGVAVIFAGEDCDFIDKCRLTAIEQHYGRSLEGLAFTTDLAIPLTDPRLFEAYRDELRRIQDITGKPIDLIVNDTLTRSLGTLNPNDAETGQLFTTAMEALIDEFGATLICNAHEPKTGGTISGTQVFLNNAPVTPNLTREGKDDTDFRIRCTMEPKFRIGPKPKPFTVKGHLVPLPKPVAGTSTDLVFKMLAPAEEPRRVAGEQEVKQQVIDALRQLTKTEKEYVTVPVLAMQLNPQEPDEEYSEYEKRLDTAAVTLRRQIMKRGNSGGKPQGFLSEFVKLTRQGTTYSPHRVFLPDRYRS
jgi:hypothetical protein